MDLNRMDDSFLCSLHKNTSGGGGNHGHRMVPYAPNRLNMRRSAMPNSLVRIRGVEGKWMKRSLKDLIRPSSHHHKRRDGFQPRPSCLSVIQKLIRSVIGWF
ncbi:hypothetical protein Dsin_030944 [Dipteronia sinensis]|uniref:Uncharacterized protein n=1 Tax=Dipteronia sinensis TaxID=43782 RepID=A0AAD9ZL06_9ROSI|nr:hypothetical protein Dsin_030944 [Dipteronia sinensis]